MNNDILMGVTRYGTKFADIVNPGEHSPIIANDRIILEKVSSDGGSEKVVQEGNVACTIGLNHLCELLASSTKTFTATDGWVQAMCIGTDSTAAASTQTSLLAFTASHHISNLTRSDAGNRTLEYQATFADTDNSYTIAEVGLMASLGNGSAIARSDLAATNQINKGLNDTVNISYQLVFSTSNEV